MNDRPLVPPPVSGPALAGRRVGWTCTPRTIGLLLLGILLVLPMGVDRRLLVVALAWDAAVLVAVAIDLAALPRPETFAVTRAWTGAAVIGVEQLVTLRVRNESTRPVTGWITDMVGPVLRVLPCELQGRWPAGSETVMTYSVVPTQRGDTGVGFVGVRYRSGAGLAERWAGAHLAQIIRVYPDIGAASRETLALIRARQVALEKRRARTFGLGRDFESLRDFQSGDELRDVCWSATARRGRLVTRTYQPERSQTVWIVVDAGRLMRAREGAATRLDLATAAAFALARVADGAGDRVGLLVYGRGSISRVPASRGAAHLRRILESLATVPGSSVEADHLRAAGAILSVQKRRALVVWLTDVAETVGVPEVIEGAARLVPRHVALFALIRPAALAALASRAPETSNDVYRVMAAQELVERRAALLAGLRERGVMAFESPSASLTGSLVDRYLRVKERNLL